MSLPSPFHLREHLAALDLEHYTWAPLLHCREENLWRFIPIYNAQLKCIQFIYYCLCVYFYILYSVCERAKHAGSVWVAPSAWRCEVPVVCSDTSEHWAVWERLVWPLSRCISGFHAGPGTQAALDHCLGKAQSIDLCNLNVVLKEKKKKLIQMPLWWLVFL